MAAFDRNKIKELKNGKGFFIFNLEKIELDKIRKLVSQHYLKIIKNKYPNLAQIALNKSMNRYHEISDKIEHSNFWPVRTRILPKEKSRDFLNLSFVKNLTNILGKFTVSDELNVGHEEIIWRIVRPNENKDVGLIHCDKWYWDLNENHIMPPDKERVKCWVSLWCEGQNGIQLYPGSQLKNFSYDSARRVSQGFGHEQKTPIFDSTAIKDKFVKIDCTPGTAVVFNDKLLHGGVTNRGSETRVSIEFVMCVNKSDFEVI